MKIELLVTIKGNEETYGKGGIYNSPLPRDLLAELSLNRGTIRVIEQGGDSAEVSVLAKEAVAELTVEVDTKPKTISNAIVEMKRPVRKRKKIG